MIKLKQIANIQYSDSEMSYYAVSNIVNVHCTYYLAVYVHLQP
jgi:hypothetical protein